MKKVLIADSSVKLMGHLQEALQSNYEVILCGKGESLEQLLWEHDPQILVLDLMLPEADGISLLRAAACAGIRPAVLAMSLYISDYVTDSLEELGVRYLMRKPCSINGLLARIMDLDTEPALGEESGVHGDANELLLHLGLRMDLQGYRYVLAAVVYLCDHPGVSVTGELYPVVAQLYGGTWQQAERAIRSCITKAWEKQDPMVWKMYFPGMAAGRVKHVSNSVFLGRIAGALTQNRDYRRRMLKNQRYRL